MKNTSLPKNIVFTAPLDKYKQYPTVLQESQVRLVALKTKNLKPLFCI